MKHTAAVLLLALANKEINEKNIMLVSKRFYSGGHDNSFSRKHLRRNAV